MPEMVAGSITVFWGVLSRGVLGPNAAIELGQNTRSSLCVRASSSTFKAATTRANAEAGTAINISADGTGATVTKTENLGAFAFDRRAFVSLAGPPESADPAIAASLGIPVSMAVEIISSNGITMGAAKWQDTGTGKLHWAPTLLWGKALGRQGSTNAANSLTDRAGIRIITA